MTSKSTLVVRYAETDQMGIVHHAVYPVWFEVARTDFIKLTGITYSDMEKMGVMTPLAGLSCRYFSPARYENVLTIEAAVALLTPARVEFCYTVYKAGCEKPICTGSTTHAWVDSGTFRPINVKKHFPALYEKMLAVMEGE